MNAQPWHVGPLLSFDTETTGVSPESDRIVTAALVDESSTSTWLIDSGVDIPEAASRIHGVTAAYAREHGASPGEALPEISQALTKAAESEVPVVVYRAAFDLSLLASELQRHGLAQPPWDQLYVVDPFVLDKKADRYRRGKRTLSDVCAHYEIELDQAHSAAADAAAALGLARAIAGVDRRIAAMSAAELHLAQVGWHADDAASLEEYFRRKGKNESVDRRWPLRR